MEHDLIAVWMKDLTQERFLQYYPPCVIVNVVDGLNRFTLLMVSI